MRLFVAIRLSDEMMKALTGTMHDLKKQGIKGSYVPMQNLHLTLAFIGEIQDLQAVKDALKNVSIKPFRLTLSQMGTFGNILWAGVKGNQGLSAAARQVRDALDEAGISYDKKKFEPHITLIRNMTGNYKSVSGPKAEMMAEKISLMKSSVKDGRRVYTEISL